MAQQTSMRDEPGNQTRKYETITIGLADQPRRTGPVNTRARTVIELDGGKVLKLDNAGRACLRPRSLASRASAGTAHRHLGSSGTVEEIERNLGACLRVGHSLLHRSAAGWRTSLTSERGADLKTPTVATPRRSPMSGSHGYAASCRAS